MSLIKMEIDNKVLMILEIDERITFIGGDSGTGKTFIIEALMDATKNPDIVKSEGLILDRIKVCASEDTTYSISNIKGNIIFLDRYDNYSEETKKLIWKKMAKQDNTWVLMSRNPDIPKNYGFSEKSYKELKTKKASNGKTLIYTVRQS